MWMCSLCDNEESCIMLCALFSMHISINKYNIEGANFHSGFPSKTPALVVNSILMIFMLWSSLVRITTTTKLTY